MKHKGFTLIEIVIVLAIAALIMVIVFVAVAGAQRSRRDTQRKRALDSITAQLETYAGNHQGKYPVNTQYNNSDTSFVNQYLKKLDEFKDPSSAENYYLSEHMAVWGQPLGECKVGFKNSPNQNGAGAVVYTSNGSQFKVKICLETGYYEKNN